jgi:DNA polymerase III alpha subunit
MTCDLEVDHIDHQFYLSNGLLTSNSHAVSYAIDSYMCAYLLTYHEAEWLCAYAETDSIEGEKKRDRALSEIKALGYEFAKIDINYATESWTILPNKKFMPSFLTCKGIGESAIEEILQNRPYSSVHELLWNPDGVWRHKKLNKRVMETLIKIGAFQSMDIVGHDKFFVNYRHMHASIIENWDLLKKKGGIQLLNELSTTGRNIEDWTREEYVKMHVELFGSLDVSMIIPPRIRNRLEEKGVGSVDDMETGDQKICWFITLSSTEKKTKTGKTYLTVECQGESGQTYRMNVWGWKPDSHKIEPQCGYLAEVEKSDFGLSTTAWKMRLIE